MNTELRKQAKNDFEKHFFKLMNNSVLGKIAKNIRKHGDIKLATTNKRRNQLLKKSKLSHNKIFSENLLAIEMKKIKVKMNKPVYLGLSILTLMYEFWYNYMKQNNDDNVKFCYVNTNSLIMHFRTEDALSMKILLMMLKKDLIHQIMTSANHCLLE